MLSLFLPFKQQPVKRPQLNKGVSAQRTRVLGHSTLSVHLKMGGREQTEEGEPETPATAVEPRAQRTQEQERRRCRQQEPPSHHATTATGKWAAVSGRAHIFVPCHRDTHDALCLPAAEPMNLTKSDTAEVPAPPAPCHLPRPLWFRSPQLKRS